MAAAVAAVAAGVVAEPAVVEAVAAAVAVVAAAVTAVAAVSGSPCRREWQCTYLHAASLAICPP